MVHSIVSLPSFQAAQGIGQVGSAVLQGGGAIASAITIHHVALGVLALLAIALICGAVYYFFFASRVKPEENFLEELKRSDLDFTLGWDPEKQETLSLGEGDKPLAKKYFNRVKGLKAYANRQAAQNLVARMEQDENISHQVVAEFKKRLQKGDYSLLGEDVAQGKSPLTEAMKEYILKEMRGLTQLRNLQGALKTYRSKLAREVRSGRLAPSPSHIRTHFDAFYQLSDQKYEDLTEKQKSEWSAAFQRMVQQTFVQQELDMTQGRLNTIPGDFFENEILKGRGFGDSEDLEVRRQRHIGEISVLMTLLKGFGTEEVEGAEIKRLISEAKLKGRLVYSGVPEEQVEGYFNLILGFQDGYAEMEKELEPQFIAMSEESSPANREFYEYLKQGYKGRVLRKFRSIAYDYAKFYSKLKTEVFSTNLANSRFVNSYYLKDAIKRNLEKNKVHEKAAERWAKGSEFFMKWASNYEGVLIQGLHDSQEIFHEGVCAAVALRWVMHELSHPSGGKEGMRDSSLYLVQPQDRKLQASAQLKVKLRNEQPWMFNDQKGIDQLDYRYNEMERRQFGIQEVVQKACIESPNREKLQQELENMDLGQSHGVVSVTISYNEGPRHAIYFRYEEGCYRVGDPNYGIVTLESKERFLDFVVDLLGNYDGVATLTLDQILKPRL